MKAIQFALIIAALLGTSIAQAAPYTDADIAKLFEKVEALEKFKAGAVSRIKGNNARIAKLEAKVENLETLAECNAIVTQCVDNPCVDDDPCTTDYFDPTTNTCKFDQMNGCTSCSADSECGTDVNSICQDGFMVTEKYTGACIAGKCEKKMTTTVCDFGCDGAVCASCTPGDSCSDGDPCTEDWCSSADGKCKHEVVADGYGQCGDSQVCISGACAPIQCSPFTAKEDCDDGDNTTLDTCNGTTGQCQNKVPECVANCNSSKYYSPDCETDNNGCTQPFFDTNTGECVQGNWLTYCIPCDTNEECADAPTYQSGSNLIVPTGICEDNGRCEQEVVSSLPPVVVKTPPVWMPGTLMANVQQTLGTWYVYTNDVQDVILENAAFDFELMGPLGFKVQNLELYINGENVTDYGDMVQLGDGQFLFTFVGYEYDIPKGTYATIEVVGMPSSFTEDDAVAIVPKAQFLGVTDDSAEEFETTWVTASTLSN